MEGEKADRDANRAPTPGGRLFDALSKEVDAIAQEAGAQAAEIVAEADREAARKITAAGRQAEILLRQGAETTREHHRDLLERAEKTKDAFLDLVGALDDTAQQLEAGAAALERTGPTPDPPESREVVDSDDEARRSAQADATEPSPADADDEGREAASVDDRSHNQLLESFRDRAGDVRKGGQVRLKRDDASSAQELGTPSKVPTGKASEGAILLATQMAVAGSSHDEIARRLRDDFGISETEPILDSLLGGRLAQ